MRDLNDSQLLRYSRHVLLPEVGVEGQRRLLDSTVLVVGLGGLGSPLAMYLAASGVGRLIIADDDCVEPSNLQRQIIHRDADVGRDKTASAKQALEALNPEVRIKTLRARLDADNLPEQVARADVVADGSDNFTTRHAVNRACIAADRPLVSAAVARMEGQVAVFTPSADSPCYECLYSGGSDAPWNDEACVENGVLAPVAGVVGAVQAVEVVKLLLDIGEPLVGRLLLFDGARMEWRSVKVPRNPGCPACSALQKNAIPAQAVTQRNAPRVRFPGD